MSDLIPAAPGWYLEETDEHNGTVLDPIVAWKPAEDSDGDDILLPYVSGGPKCPPLLLNAIDFQYWKRTVVYRPSHDPANDN